MGMCKLKIELLLYNMLNIAFFFLLFFFSSNNGSKDCGRLVAGLAC